MQKTQLKLEALWRLAVLAALPVALAVPLGACGSSRTPAFMEADGGAGDLGSGMPCTGTGQTRCGGACVDITSSVGNCGGCGMACAGGQVCLNGMCATQCPASQVGCGPVCVTTATDGQNCGACGHGCLAGQVCSGGVCTLECGPAYMACAAPVDAGAAGGPDRWCTDPRTDERNCGGCGTVCPAGQLCVAGACTATCPATEALCGAVCADLQLDPAHCGTCGTVCPTGQRCAAGACSATACGPGTTLCDGRCVDTSRDSAHCGACGTACPVGNFCAMGACTIACLPTLTACAGRCVDTMADRTDCGMCGHACADGFTCQMGACALACPTGNMACGGRCVDPTTDRANCGGCGTACGAGQLCTGGACAPACAPGQTNCGGVCVTTTVDPGNCGACGVSCGMGFACGGGFCRPLVGTDAAGCTPPSTMCGAACADTRSDNANCGGCGRPCSADRTCVLGMCVATCAAGLVRCGTVCSDVQADAANCGACGHACAAGMYCIHGACGVAPLTRYRAVSPAPASVTFLDACTAPGHMTYLALADDDSVLVPLPFAFRYWATDLPAGASINLCSNGWLGMDGVMDPTSFGVIPDPGGFGPFAVIAPNWTDEVNRTPGQCVATFGAAPARQWVAEWSDGRHCCTDDPAVHETYEAVLTEGSNTIDLVYQRMDGARSATVGLMNQDDSVGIGGCAGGATMCTAVAGTNVRFVPIP